MAKTRSMESDDSIREALSGTEARTRLAAAGVMLDRLLHDLKQPLNLIRVTAQDVRLDVKKDRLEMDELSENMFEIEKAIDQVVSRIDVLRSFALPKRGDHTPPADLKNVCQAAIQRIADAYPGIEIEGPHSEGSTLVEIEPFYLEQVVWELLDNAARAASGAGRDRAGIEVQIFPRDREVVATIKDNGGGVAEGASETMFEPFFTTREEAAGIGLALAQAIVTRGGGRIALARSDDQGSVFEVSLPGSSNQQAAG